MCKSPNKLDDGTLVGCRNCTQCSERRILDWQGRCIAESKVNPAANTVTLTYGGELDADGEQTDRMDHVRMAVLTYSDVQKYFKRLRKAGFPLTYFVAGEYGSTKGRSHWHAIIFWHGPVPKHELNTEKYMQQHWPHGFSFWDETGSGSVRYCCKYVQKDLNDAEAQGMLRMSKKPPIGARYFAQRAQQYVDQGLAPQDLFYSFDEARYPDGKKLRFMLSGRSAELFLQEYMLRFRGYPVGYADQGKREKLPCGGYRRKPKAFHGPPCPVRGWHYPPSKLVEEYEDKLARNAPVEFDDLALSIMEDKRKATPWENHVLENPEEKAVSLEDYHRRRNRARDYATRMQSGFLE